MTRPGPAREAFAEQVADALLPPLRAQGLEVLRPPEAAAQAASLEGELDEAERAYANLRPGEARAKLDTLLEQLDDSGGDGLDRDGLVRGLLLLALSASAEGDEQAAEAAITRALTIDPGLAPDPARYPPPLRERIAGARGRLDLQPRVRLSFEGLPEGTRVVVDGEALPAGESATRVATGTHWVRLEGEGWRPQGHLVEVAEQERHFRWTLEPDPGALLRLAGDPGGPPTEAVRRGAAALDAAPLLVDATAQGHGTRVVVRDLVSARAVRTTAPEGADPRQVARELARGLDIPGPAEPADRAQRRRRWIGAAAGVVAAAIVTGVAVSLATGGGGEQWRATGSIAE